jgi:ribulose-phosphate 3-epimerase
MLQRIGGGLTPSWVEELPENRLLAEVSLWSADLARLEDEVRRVEAGADIFHFDASDGHFAPAFLFFPDLVSRIRKITAKPFHVHLMAKDDVLLDQISQFAAAGANIISIHAENKNLSEALGLIQSAGLRAGLVLQLSTPVSAAAAAFEIVDMVTLLGTGMGVKGQELSNLAAGRMHELKRAIRAFGRRRIVASADGGIRESTVPLLRSSGADAVVMGSLAFAAADLAARISWLRGLH